MSTDIFISYRRDDSRDQAVRLAGELRAQFGASTVFLDSGMEPGIDFRQRIDRALSSCYVLIALIGENWLFAQGPSGRRRLDEPEDLVAREIATALARDVRVIPVLVGGTSMPHAGALPKQLIQLADRVAHQLTLDAYDADLAHLVRELHAVVPSRHAAGIARTNAMPMESSDRQQLLDEIHGCIAVRANVAIGGAPGIGKTWLLNAVAAEYPLAVRVFLERDPDKPAMGELRVALDGRFGVKKYRRNDDAGLVELQRIVPADTLLLVDNADELASAYAVKRLTQLIPNLIVVVTSRSAHEFREFRRIERLPLLPPDAQAVIDDYELDASSRIDVLSRSLGNPHLLHFLADAAKHDGASAEDDRLRAMLEHWPAESIRTLWIIGELPSSILAHELLKDVGDITDGALHLLRRNAVVTSFSIGRPDGATRDAPNREPLLLACHPVLRLACQTRLQTVGQAALRELRVDIAAYYVGWLRSGPTIEAIHLARPNVLHLIEALDKHAVCTVLADLIGYRFGDAVHTEPAVIRDPPPGDRVAPPGCERPYPLEFDEPWSFQKIVTRFLDAELDHSVRAYRVANDKLEGVLDALGALEERGIPLLEGVKQVASTAIALNDGQLQYRHAVTNEDGSARTHRRPKPPPSLLDEHGASRLLDLYDVAQQALGPLPVAGDDLGVIRCSMMLDPDYQEPEAAHALRLRERFVHRERVAVKELGLVRVAEEAGVAASEFSHADLEHGQGWVATDVLLVLKQAHRYVHEVEYARSQSVSGMLRRSKDDIAEERLLLRRSIVLSTLSLVVSQVVPWAFAADADERKMIQDDLRAARERTYPAQAMWVARQVTMLSLYRRAHGFRLLADHERSYNDYRKLQQIGRYSRPKIGGSAANLAARTVYVDILSALGEYRIGELYRSDHDYTRALKHLCSGHDRLLHAGHDDLHPNVAPPEVRFPRLEVHLRLGKGTAYFETGEMTHALKWHVKAWLSLEVLIGLEHFRRREPQDDHPLERVAIEALAGYLDGVRHEPDLDKDKLKFELQPIVGVMCARDIPVTLKALAADVLGRIGHILLMLNFADDSAPRCLKRAVQLDPYNLFARTALLRWRLVKELDWSPREQRPELMDPASLPEPVSCWSTGATRVDRAIRVGIHLLLRRLLHDACDNDKNKPGERQYVDRQVARALITRFVDRTDSIYRRLEVTNHHLLRRRLEDLRPELAEQPSAEPYLQLISLRRYGGLANSDPRPAAVSAVGGGYLVRACSLSTDPDNRRRAFNVLVDPGDDVIDSLYCEGFGIADIDMVIVTNEHPEHLAALDAILALSDGRRPIELAALTPGAEKPDDRLLLVGTTGVIKRYLGHPQLSVRDLGKRLMVREKLPQGVAVRQLEAIYKDPAGKDPVSFVLTFDPYGEGAARSITFMSDAATEAVGDFVDERVAAIDEEAVHEWRTALASDIVVASVGEVSVGELRDLALPAEPEDRTDVASAFDDCVKELETEGHTGEALQIRLALSLISAEQDLDKRAGLLEPSPWSAVGGSNHLDLRGLLAVAQMMSEPSRGDSVAQPRVLVVRELRLQTGPFGRTIADEINKHLFSERRTFAVTADIGLRIRLGRADRGRVLCSVCSLNNDRLDMERYHDPRLVKEVPVMGDEESTYWMCGIHNSERAIFTVHRGGYRSRPSGALPTRNRSEWRRAAG